MEEKIAFQRIVSNGVEKIFDDSQDRFVRATKLRFDDESKSWKLVESDIFLTYKGIDEEDKLNDFLNSFLN